MLVSAAEWWDGTKDLETPLLSFIFIYCFDQDCLIGINCGPTYQWTTVAYSSSSLNWRSTPVTAE